MTERIIGGGRDARWLAVSRREEGKEKEEEDKEEGVMMVTGEGTQMQGAELILSVARHDITTP